jgi:hypothetical protein
MLSTGEWIRNKKFLGLRSNLNNDSIPVFDSSKSSDIQGRLNVGSVRSILQTGSSRIRNVASDRTSLLALRAGTYLSKSERLNPTNSLVQNTPVTTVNSLCGCQTGTVEKVGLCPSCRTLL